MGFQVGFQLTFAVLGLAPMVGIWWLPVVFVFLWGWYNTGSYCLFGWVLAPVVSCRLGGFVAVLATVLGCCFGWFSWFGWIAVLLVITCGLCYAAFGVAGGCGLPDFGMLGGWFP